MFVVDILQLRRVPDGTEISWGNRSNRDTAIEYYARARHIFIACRSVAGKRGTVSCLE